MIKSRCTVGIICATVLIFGLAGPSMAQRWQHPSSDNPPVILDGNPVQALFVQESRTAKVYMVAGAGSNITLQVGDEGVLLVDTGSARMEDKTLAAIQHLTRQLTDQPIRWIINTHFHPDATGGNEVLAKAGQWVAQNISSGGVPIFGRRNEALPASIIAQENVLRRMSAPTLTEPVVHTSAWVRDKRVEFVRHPCAPQETTVEVVRPPGVIPHFLPGKNDTITTFAETYGLPFEATRGYAEALYPEYKEKLKKLKPMTKGSKAP